jgi:hypothetical protein
MWHCRHISAIADVGPKCLMIARGASLDAWHTGNCGMPTLYMPMTILGRRNNRSGMLERHGAFVRGKRRSTELSAAEIRFLKIHSRVRAA